MCGGGYPTSPFGFNMQQGYMEQAYPYYSDLQQQMMGIIGYVNPQAMGNMYGMQGSGDWAPPKKKPKKRCVCAYCGRPMKMDQDETCKGCGAWEVEFV